MNKNRVNKQTTNLNRTTRGPYPPHQSIRHRIFKNNQNEKLNTRENPRSSNKHTWTIWTAIVWLLAIIPLQSFKKTSEPFILLFHMKAIKNLPAPPPCARNIFFYVSILVSRNPIYWKENHLSFLPFSFFFPQT